MVTNISIYFLQVLYTWLRSPTADFAEVRLFPPSLHPSLDPSLFLTLPSSLPFSLPPSLIGG